MCFVDAARVGLAPFHEDGPREGPEIFAIEGEPKLAHLENMEERLQLGPEFLLAYDRWALFHRLFCVSREAQPARALPRHAFEHRQECGEIPRANAVIDTSVEHDIVRPAEVDPRRDRKSGRVGKECRAGGWTGD